MQQNPVRTQRSEMLKVTLKASEHVASMWMDLLHELSYGRLQQYYAKAMQCLQHRHAKKALTCQTSSRLKHGLVMLFTVVFMPV